MNEFQQGKGFLKMYAFLISFFSNAQQKLTSIFNYIDDKRKPVILLLDEV